MGEHTVSENQLSLAVNHKAGNLRRKLVAFEMPADHVDRLGNGGSANSYDNGHAARLSAVAIVGMGYVGLPTALGLYSNCPRIIGIDISRARLHAIAGGEADLTDLDLHLLDRALQDGSLELSSDTAAVAEADAVIICVPTPVDSDHVPDLAALRGACGAVVAHARAGQTIILTSTSYVGTTRDLLIGPLEQRGMRVGEDVFVAFSPERIDPGNSDHLQRETPRVIGGATEACAEHAAQVIKRLTDVVYVMSSAEAAEATKLYENVFRAVTLALANEFADVCGTLQLDPIEVTLAAGTKPYGFLGTFPGPGVGGHCIPCDPYYLLWQLGGSERGTPLIEQAMKSINTRPDRVVERASEVLAEAGGGLAGAKVIVVGVSYKPGVADLRESPALDIIAGLISQGAEVEYHDPVVPQVRLRDGRLIDNLPAPKGADFDLAVIHTLHPGIDHSWAQDCPQILDATYQFDGAPNRAVV